jgi:hypothetical protein
VSEAVLPPRSSVPLPEDAPAVRARHLAWLVLGVSFLVFCSICTAVGVGVNFFLFESTLPLNARLVVARGTVGLAGIDRIEQVVRTRETLTTRARIRTDRQSQATVSLYEGLQDEVWVAAVTVNPDSTLDIGSFTRPRFDWSSRRYELVLRDASGSFDVTIAPDLPREAVVTIRTAAGDYAMLTASGRYEVRVTDAHLIVTNYNGEAALYARDGSVDQVVGRGQRGALAADTLLPTLGSAHVDLIGASEMSAENVTLFDGSTASVRPGTWVCSNSANAGPLGQTRLATLEGRGALHLVRGTGTTTHGESVCAMNLGADAQGLDVREYDYLGLRVVFRIEGHSLSTCGTLGSECPMMLRLEYVPVSGARARSWVHGFYAFFDPMLTYPLVCDSCTQEHEFVNAGTWYSYRSENLLSLLPPELHPGSILAVRFIASGHDYDVYVSSLEFYAGSNGLPTELARADGQ